MHETIVNIDEAEARLNRFAPFIERMFPEAEKASLPLMRIRFTSYGQPEGIWYLRKKRNYIIKKESEALE